ncbi:diacylglycerol kinase family protein [Oscillospiraceae bacterium WX1]
MKKSFRCAFSGVIFCLKSERNCRVHLAAAIYVLLSSAICRLSAGEWALVLLCIGLVTGAELLNTAVEKLCDALHPEYSAAIGRVKDMAAGAVLMAALLSAAIGGIIFFNGEKLTRFFAFTASHIAVTVLLLASLPAAAVFIFRRYDNDSKNSHDHHRGETKRR